jgi:hypothetical protein
LFKKIIVNSFFDFQKFCSSAALGISCGIIIPSTVIISILHYCVGAEVIYAPFVIITFGFFSLLGLHKEHRDIAAILITENIFDTRTEEKILLVNASIILPRYYPSAHFATNLQATLVVGVASFLFFAISNDHEIIAAISAAILYSLMKMNFYRKNENSNVECVTKKTALESDGDGPQKLNGAIIYNQVLAKLDEYFKTRMNSQNGTN